MSKISSFAKTKFILKMLGNIDTIIERHNGIVNALEDEVEAQPAILMSLMQIGESLKKLDSDILEKFDLQEESKGSYSVRNFIAHDYEGVNMMMVEEIIRNRIPILKEKVLKVKEYFENDTD